MDEHTQEPNVPVASAQTTDETKVSAVKDKEPLQELLQIYFVKHTELRALANTNSLPRLDIRVTEHAIGIRTFFQRLGSRTLDLDNLSTLDPYNDLLAESQKCLAHQVDYNARERVIQTKLKEIMALEAEIMANSASELESLSLHVREAFAAKMKSTSYLRIDCLRNYWEDISRRSKINPE